MSGTGLSESVIGIVVLVLLVLLVLIGVTIVALLRIFGGETRRKDNPDARQLLDERYAQGELSRDEYHQIAGTSRVDRTM